MKLRKELCFQSLILLKCPILTSNPHRKRLDRVLISSADLKTHPRSQRFDLAQQTNKITANRKPTSVHRTNTATHPLPRHSNSNALTNNQMNAPPHPQPNHTNHIPSPPPSPLTDELILQYLSGPDLTVTIMHPLRSTHASALWAREGQRAYDILDDIWRALFTTYLERRETEGHESASMQARAKSVIAVLEQMLENGVDVAWEGRVYATNRDVRVGDVGEVGGVEEVE